MYEFYSTSTSTLAEDDIRGIQHIYGVPPNRKYKPDDKAKEEEEDMPVWGQTPIYPDKCNTSYDAIAMIDDELIVFRRKYMFGPNIDTSPIRDRWQGLPSSLTRVDAVFQTSDRKILFFINQDVYVFSGSKFNTYKLSVFGMNSSTPKIDAIFRKSDNNQVYIFVDKFYYRFDEHKMKVGQNKYRITNVFKDVFDYETGFTYKDDKTYFFKNQSFYEFDNEHWVLKRMQPRLSANFFMNCNITEPENEIVDRFGINDDFIDVGPDLSPEKPNCDDNPEIPCNDPNGTNMNRSYIFTLIVIIPRFFV